MPAERESPVPRYHGLDGLRGFAMLLGIVLHATLPYISRLAEFEHIWPADDDQSVVLFVVFDFIHIWRMPTFFLMAGFFAHLVLTRQTTSAFVRNRLKRIALPLVLFGAAMAVLVPLIWVYGWYGILTLESLAGWMTETPDLESSGELVAHLWFLYYLLLMYAALVAVRLLAGRWKQLSLMRLGGLATLGRVSERTVYTRLPLLLAAGAVLLLIAQAGDESKPLWPLNWPDVIYGALFFFYGYGLYTRRDLIERIRGTATLATLWMAATAGYVLHLALIGAMDEIWRAGGGAEAIAGLQLADTLVYGVLAALFSMGLIGLFERFLRAPRPWIRWLADSSYWIYIIHLPVVTMLTFYLAHLDRQGSLEQLTGVSWNAEVKFLVACVATGLVGVITYRYLVRYTPIGTMLNGRRTKTQADRLGSD